MNGIRITDSAQLGPLLADLRRLNRLSQRALAAQAGCKQCQISLWEVNASHPTLGSLIRLAAALGYDLALIPKDTP